MNHKQPHHKGRALGVTIGAVMVLAMLGVPLVRALQQQNDYQKQYEQAKNANQQAVIQHRQVAEEHQRLQDSDYLAGVARRDYYYTKPGEMVFILKGEEADNAIFEQEATSESEQQ
ncbi:MAG: septum formation initiator family protein [Aerococcaceae bacterium]|nr:septum formation initiator family protein [Aerococcaceae bacterium]